jgi:hypothetical protein
MWVGKCNIGIMTLNPHYLWEAKILNPHIKHGTFLVEFDDRIKTICHVRMHGLIHDGQLRACQSCF